MSSSSFSRSDRLARVEGMEGSARPVASRAALLWGGLAALVLMPIGIAAASPLLQWRGPVYIAGGFAGIAALGLLLVQPLLAGNALPGFSPRQARRLHRWIGMALLVAVLLHVMGLWITSPPDVIDVLLFRSPTPFSVWGALAMWAAIGAGALALLRRRLRIRPRTWRNAHLGLAIITAGGTVAHAMLIEGAMGTVSKAVLCAAVVVATGWIAWRTWRPNRA